jgi:formiminoglutamate deiminase
VTTWWCEWAWLGGEHAEAGVVIEADAGVVTALRTGVAATPSGAVTLPGLTVPGLANAHSHAFHRALRGRTHDDEGTFWTWRDQMYALAARLDPDSYHRLARATFAEMALAGVTCVGEFHYLHRGPGGVPYADPNAMGAALAAAAAEAGVRLTLLDTCYLAGGIGQEPNEIQRRFSDGDVLSWATRASAGDSLVSPLLRQGAAIHSVRAVPPASMEVVAAWAAGRAVPLHVHLSEQPAENQQCLLAYAMTPTELLAERGVLGPRTTAVHATHLTPTDLARLGSGGVTACLCPTTERDLADGIGPATALREAGCPLALGSDSHAVIDLLEEARAVELDERLARLRRGNLAVTDLWRAATQWGHRALGWPEAGRIAVGALGDFATLRLDSVRTAGIPADHVLAGMLFSATAADVHHVVVGGEVVVRDGRHRTLDVERELREALAPW